MQIIIHLTGSTPLMMHNERLSDPDNEYTRQIKEITGKGTNQTDKDKELISKLEWHGGLYTDEAKNVIVPTTNLVRCFREAAAVTRGGKKVARAISPSKLFVPLLLTDKPRNQQELWGNPIYVDRRPVKVSSARIKRTRPIFPQWQLIIDFELQEDVLSFAAFENIVELAGRAIGLGDARILGHGRFKVALKKSR